MVKLTYLPLDALGVDASVLCLIPLPPLWVSAQSLRSQLDISSDLLYQRVRRLLTANRIISVKRGRERFYQQIEG